jgi:hypothetical protein
MLVKKSKFKNGEIVSLKLVTGEEVVGAYSEEDVEFVHLDKPYRLIQNGQSFGFAPLMVTTDPDKLHSVFKTSIAVITPTFEEVKTQYDKTVKSILEPEFTEVKK